MILETVQNSKEQMREHGENSISHLGPKIWDLVPAEMKFLDSLSQFKTAIKCWKTGNCPCRICKTYISQVGFI